MGFKSKVVLITSVISMTVATTILILAVLSSRAALKTQIEDQLLSHGQNIQNMFSKHQEKLQVYAKQLGDNRLLESMLISFEAGFYSAGNAPGKDVANYKINFDAGTKALMERARKLSADFDFMDTVLVRIPSWVLLWSKGSCRTRNWDNATKKPKLPNQAKCSILVMKSCPFTMPSQVIYAPRNSPSLTICPMGLNMAT